MALAENAGLDPIDIMVQLRAAHEKGHLWEGVDLVDGKTADLKEKGILEPLGVKMQVVKSAAEAAGMILKIDDVIAAAKTRDDKGPPKDTTRVAKREAVSSREQDTIAIGPPKLTLFEKARVVGARALQVSMGAPILLDSTDASMSPIDIALLELEEGVLPISIRRSLPDGTSQNIPLKWLIQLSQDRKTKSRKES